ncbi:hypothetical protein ACFUKV_03450 [Streptomyces paradoxus]|uniref:hypothetical protein n=1 Tax=Streptomyces paradoxus TaxID=66375 RepID=UPI00362B418A
MLAIIVTEGLKDPDSLQKIPGKEIKRYTLPLNNGTVEIVELAVAEADVNEACLQLSAAMLPERYYGQVQDDNLMYVIFPNSIAVVRRDDRESEETAQRIGSLFSIPISQMSFLEMFSNAHPDVDNV